MPLLDQIQKQMVAAMKAREEARLNALRMVKAALMKHKVDTMKELDEAEELKILNMLIKQRREAADMFRQGGRIDQAEKEEVELRMIEGFMPAAPSDEEIAAAIDADRRNRCYVIEADGRGDEGRAGKARRQAGGR